MNTLPAKSWSATASASKKYLSRLLTHKLSSRLNPKIYDVVFEMPLKRGGNSEPDVVVFNKCKGWTSIMAIEICRTDEISDMLIIARGLMDKYTLLDFFLFDHESKVWYNIKKRRLGYEITSNTFFLGIALDRLYE
jgi:hypothetical protein